MKKALLGLLALTTLFAGTAQVDIKEKNVNIDGSKNGFYITIPYGDEKHIEKELKDELKDWKGKYSTPSGYIFVDDCKLKDMGDNTFDVYAKVEKNPDGGGFVSLAIDLGGAFLNSGEHGAQFKAMETRLYNFGVKAAKSAVDEEIKNEEKILSDYQKELEDLEKEQEKLEKEIEDYKKRIEDNEKAIEEAKKNQENKKEEIKTQETKVEEVKKKKEAVK